MRSFSFPWLFVLCTLIFAQSSAAQTSLSKEERLYHTCKIWGFLKYYHPVVGKGVFDWDDKLQKILGTTASYSSYEEFTAYMNRWINLLGPVPPCRGCSESNRGDHFLKNFDLSWTQDRQYVPELRATLQKVAKNRFQGDHYYINRGDIGHFEPKNESQNFNFTWKDENMRLLPLFRYWNYIEYFFPYKYQTSQSWDDVLKEMIPIFLNVNTELDFHLAMLQMIVKTDDTHGRFLTQPLDEWPYFNYLPVKLSMVENTVVVSEIVDPQKAAALDLEVGDIIKSVNGTPAISIHQSNKKYIWGSNDAVKDLAVSYSLFMGLKNPPMITIERNGSAATKERTLYKLNELNIVRKEQEKWKTIGDSIGYVNLGVLSVNEVDGIMNRLMENPVIILDVRNYPRGTYRALAKYLNPTDTIFAKYIKPDFDYPGKFVWSGEGTCGADNPNYYKGKVILLVNAETQSHGEFTVMSLQTAPNAITVGSTTAGTDGNVTKFAVLNRYYSYMSGIGVFYPDGSEAQRVGVKIDEKVTPTLEGIRQEKDEILDRALEIAREELDRLQEIARQEEIARLQRLDSMRMDSLRNLTLPVDSLGGVPQPMDSLNIPIDDQ